MIRETNRPGDRVLTFGREENDARDVIPSEAKQSRIARETLDCFVAFGSSQ
ncbi:hypothetical protein [Bradyrhizobium sp. STM 3557]|uniref:hypothetical protein n=1 Tax=Bradyrhizobium sp. STM 3557 TaxID=578920 RepID=UPI00388E3572